MPFPSPTHLEFFGSALDVVMREFRDLYAQLTGWLSKEHKGDGTHAHVTAYDVTVDEFVGFAQTGAFLSAGTGSPEDVVTAPPGSLWLEDDGGGTAVLWLKETGTGDTGWIPLGAGTGGGGAPVDAQYVTLATDPTLTQERVLTAGANITITDGGPNGPVTIAAASVSSMVQAAYVTIGNDANLTSERALTAGANISITDGGANGTVTIASPSWGDVVGPASSVDGGIVLFNGTTGKLIKQATGTGFVRAVSGVYSASPLTRVVGCVIGDGVTVITTGAAGCVSAPVSGTITKVRLLSSDPSILSGSIVLDIWKDTYTNYPPVVGDTITASAKPTISSTTKAEDSTLTGWTTSVTAGDVFRFNVDSVTSLTRVTVELTVAE